MTYFTLPKGDVGSPLLQTARPKPQDPAWRAIELALATRFDTARDCFKWLYDYGAEPLSAARIATPGIRDSILSSSVQARLDATMTAHIHGAWHIWAVPDEHAKPPTFKVYLNPCYDDLPRIVMRLADWMADDYVAGFKTVAERWMAVRPDKCIAYFHTKAARDTWLTQVRPSLPDIRANPTPFTTFATPDGLLTTARDPVDQPGQSWRSTFLRGLADEVIATQSQSQSRPDAMKHLRDYCTTQTSWHMI